MATIALPAAIVRSKFWRVRFLSYSTPVLEDEEKERSNATAERTVQRLQDSVQHSSSQSVVSATIPAVDPGSVHLRKPCKTVELVTV